MKLYLKRAGTNIDAVADYTISKDRFVVLKGSVVSDYISSAPTFKSARSVKKWRDELVEDNVLKEDVVFKSSSTAANFVTGTSSNGKLAWKNGKGVPLRELLKKDSNQ